MFSNRFTYRACATLFATLFAIGIYAEVGTAQNADPAPVDSITSSSIQAKLDAIEANTTLSESVKATATRIYKEILTELEKETTLTKQRDEFKSRISSIDADRVAIEKALDSEPEKPSIDTGGMTLDAIEEQLREKQAEAKRAKDELAELEAAQPTRDKRRTEFPPIIAKLTEQIAAPLPDAPADATPEIEESHRMLCELRRRNAQQELELIQQEGAYYSADRELLPRRIQLRQRIATLADEELQLWREAAAQLLEKERQDQTADAKTAVEQTSEELKEFAEENLALTGESTELAGKIKQARQLAQETLDRANQLQRDFEAAEERLDDDGGITESMGDHLRRQRATLPSPRALNLSSRERRETIYDVRDRRYEITQRSSELNRIEVILQRELSNLTASVEPDQLPAIEAELRTLLESRRELLSALQRDYGIYLDDLVEINVQVGRQIVVSERFKEFIDAKVLWIRSTRPASLGDLQESLKAIELLSRQLSDEWVRLLRSVPNSLIRKPWPQAVALALAISLILSRSVYTQRIADLGVTARRSTCFDFSITIKAVLWTILRAASVPTALMWLALNLRYTSEVQESSIAYPLSQALFTAAAILFVLSLWRILIRPGGVGDSHFDWSSHVLELSQNNLMWLTPIFVIAATIEVYSHSTNDPSWERSLGRFPVIVGQLALAVFLWRMMSPGKGVFKQYLADHPNGWAYRLRKIWFALLVGLPVVFAVLAFAGYVYTTTHLFYHLCLSLLFLGLLLLTESLGLRWLRLNRRELALSQARERLAASTTSEDGGVVEDEQIDLHEVNQQTERLLNSFGVVVAILGLYLIWVDMLPALAKLDEVHLWRTTMSMTQNVDPVEGSDQATNTVMTVQVVEWITLRHLLAAMLILFVMIVAVRNIPGLLEIAILQHLPLDSALRFAIKTVTRYAIIMAGSTAALGALGIGWSKVQWLVAAVSVGLGFGLQEIFANFVSGLILLFERPLRAGDIVTVGNVTGKVVQIKTRATTIQDWDRKELVVPNKEFITSHLLNWTLSDKTNRVVILVGIAYGSDVAKARRILLDVARDQRQILAEPEPSVTFDQFADSSLNLTLRAYLPDMDERLTVIHEMHEAIHQRLAGAGIEIPFPQRDVHLRPGDGSIKVIQSASGEAS